MNLSLLDPFVLAQEYPEQLTSTLTWGHSTCIRFNTKGDYLASGLLDGSIVIFDFDTNSVVKTLRKHVRPIQLISWSDDGRYLLSSARDWKAIIWDLETGSPVHIVNLGAPVWGASFGRGTDQFIASLYEDDPKLVKILDNNQVSIQKLPTIVPKAQTDTQTNGDVKPNKKPEKHLTLVTVFTKNNDYILAGTSKGYVNVISVDTLEIVRSFQITSSNIKNMVLCQSGRIMALNSSDRIIRVLRLPDFTNTDPETWEIDVEHKFQNVVNRFQWNSVTINLSGEYVLASTYESAHDIYMWEVSQGTLVKIYDGPKEEMVDVIFHPNKPIVCATGLDSGAIYIWTYVIPQKWSALAPDFVELEENEEYHEKEDEFDIEDEAAYNQRQLDDEEELVDILTVERARGEYGENSFILPISLEIEEHQPVSDDDD